MAPSAYDWAIWRMLQPAPEPEPDPVTADFWNEPAGDDVGVTAPDPSTDDIAEGDMVDGVLGTVGDTISGDSTGQVVASPDFTPLPQGGGQTFGQDVSAAAVETIDGLAQDPEGGVTGGAVTIDSGISDTASADGIATSVTGGADSFGDIDNPSPNPASAIVLGDQSSTGYIGPALQAGPLLSGGAVGAFLAAGIVGYFAFRWLGRK